MGGNNFTSKKLGNTILKSRNFKNRGRQTTAVVAKRFGFTRRAKLFNKDSKFAKRLINSRITRHNNASHNEFNARPREESQDTIINYPFFSGQDVDQRMSVDQNIADKDTDLRITNIQNKCIEDTDLRVRTSIIGSQYDVDWRDRFPCLDYGTDLKRNNFIVPVERINSASTPVKSFLSNPLNNTTGTLKVKTGAYKDTYNKNLLSLNRLKVSGYNKFKQQAESNKRVLPNISSNRQINRLKYKETKLKVKNRFKNLLRPISKLQNNNFNGKVVNKFERNSNLLNSGIKDALSNLTNLHPTSSNRSKRIRDFDKFNVKSCNPLSLINEFINIYNEYMSNISSSKVSSLGHTFGKPKRYIRKRVSNIQRVPNSFRLRKILPYTTELSPASWKLNNLFDKKKLPKVAIRKSSSISEKEHLKTKSTNILNTIQPLLSLNFNDLKSKLFVRNLPITKRNNTQSLKKDNKQKTETKLKNIDQKRTANTNRNFLPGVNFFKNQTVKKKLVNSSKNFTERFSHYKGIIDLNDSKKSNQNKVFNVNVPRSRNKSVIYLNRNKLLGLNKTMKRKNTFIVNQNKMIKNMFKKSGVAVSNKNKSLQIHKLHADGNRFKESRIYEDKNKRYPKRNYTYSIKSKSIKRNFSSKYRNHECEQKTVKNTDKNLTNEAPSINNLLDNINSDLNKELISSYLDNLLQSRIKNDISKPEILSNPTDFLKKNPEITSSESIDKYLEELRNVLSFKISNNLIFELNVKKVKEKYRKIYNQIKTSRATILLKEQPEKTTEKINVSANTASIPRIKYHKILPPLKIKVKQTYQSTTVSKDAQLKYNDCQTSTKEAMIDPTSTIHQSKASLETENVHLNQSEYETRAANMPQTNKPVKKSIIETSKQKSNHLKNKSQNKTPAPIDASKVSSLKPSLETKVSTSEPDKQPLIKTLQNLEANLNSNEHLSSKILALNNNISLENSTFDSLCDQILPPCSHKMKLNLTTTAADLMQRLNEINSKKHPFLFSWIKSYKMMADNQEPIFNPSECMMSTPSNTTITENQICDVGTNKGMINFFPNDTSFNTPNNKENPNVMEEDPLEDPIFSKTHYVQDNQVCMDTKSSQSGPSAEECSFNSFITPSTNRSKRLKQTSNQQSAIKQKLQLLNLIKILSKKKKVPTATLR